MLAQSSIPKGTTAGCYLLFLRRFTFGSEAVTSVLYFVPCIEYFYEYL